MAAGDTDIAICSRALTLLGAAAISAFNEGTDVASTCDRLYPSIKEALLQMYPWKFATTKLELARLVGTPVNEWLYKYQLPGDALGGPQALFNSGEVGARPLTSGWEIYEDTILTDFEEVYIDYRFDPGEAKYPRYFVMLLIYDLCAHLAKPITDQDTVADYWRTVAFGTPQENGRGGYFRQAANTDGSSAPPESLQDFPLIAVRF
jgi:hypothetical protein